MVPGLFDMTAPDHCIYGERYGCDIHLDFRNRTQNVVKGISLRVAERSQFIRGLRDTMRNTWL